MVWEVRHTSVLPVERDTLWAVVGTMDGVNAELMPLVRMTVPRGAEGLRFEEAPLGELVFNSWLMIGGVLPFDRHALSFAEIEPGSHFVEVSSSWLQRIWRHERVLTDAPGGCRITDVVIFKPRLSLLGPLVRFMVAQVFAHRHRRLRARYPT